MSEIVKVPFHGDELECVRDDRGVWVSVRRACESLGMDPDGQRRRLQRQPWAVTDMMSATGPDGKTYEACCVHLDSLPMWLATIEASRVKEETREKLVAYQREAARVLRDHFFRAPPRIEFERALVEAFAPLNARIAVLESRLTQLNAASLPQGVIGKDAAKYHVLAEINQIAGKRCLANGDSSKGAMLRERKRLDDRLRTLAEYPRSRKCAWEMLDVDKLGTVRRELARERDEVESLLDRQDAARAKNMPQLILPSLKPSAAE